MASALRTDDLLQYVNITILCRRMLLLIYIIRVLSNRVQIIILLLNWHSSFYTLSRRCAWSNRIRVKVAVTYCRESLILMIRSLSLSFPRNQAEMAHTCRGTISLHGALIHTVDSSTFVISNGGTQTFHIKAGNEVERQSWVTALELAKAKAM